MHPHPLSATVLLLALCACTTATQTTIQNPSPPTTASTWGPEVVAVADMLELNGLTDEILDPETMRWEGEVVVWNVVRFVVVDSQVDISDSILAYCSGLPSIGERRIQLGDRVVFQLPPAGMRSSIQLEGLRGLRFAE